jgi:hypothetical protein
MQAWGSGPALPPQNYVVPNVTFAEPYTQYPQLQQSMAIIGGYAPRNMSKGTTTKIINTNHRRRIKKKKEL